MEPNACEGAALEPEGDEADWLDTFQAFEAQQRRKLQQEADRERKQATMRQAMAKASARAAPELSWSLP